MRLIGMIVSGSLAMAVVAEGAYIVHTRRQVAPPVRQAGRHRQRGRGPAERARRARCHAALHSRRDAGRTPAGRGRPGAAAPTAGDLRRPWPRHPRHSESDNPLPLPPAIDTPEAREQLRRFVLAQLEQERQEGRQRQEQMRNEREQQRRERMAKDLGLSRPGDRKVQPDHDPDPVRPGRPCATGSSRDRLRARTSGTSLRPCATRAQKQMRSLLGDDRMKKFEEMRGRMGRPGAGPTGPMQGGGRRGWGGPRNGQGGGPSGAAPAP